MENDLQKHVKTHEYYDAKHWKEKENSVGKKAYVRGIR